MSRLHFYVLEERKFWRRGDRLHIPVYAPLHKNQKKPIEGKTVIMTYISGSPENKRANLWECRCVGVNGRYILGFLHFFQAISTIHISRRETTLMSEMYLNIHQESSSRALLTLTSTQIIEELLSLLKIPRISSTSLRRWG